MSGSFPEYVPPTKIAYISGRPAALHLRKCKLVIEREDGQASEYIFDQNNITVGAMEDNDLVLEDDTVSRYHCRIYQDENSYLIQDQESTNGTFINRVRIKEAYLKPGCTVTITSPPGAVTGRVTVAMPLVTSSERVTDSGAVRRMRTCTPAVAAS